MSVPETSACSCPLEARPATRGAKLKAWLKANRYPILFALLLLAVLPMRDLWAPDEPDFAQCVKEMRQRDTWLLPYLNGLPYSEKPILFYWLMKACALAGEKLTGGLGFTQGVAAWALRLPPVVASAAFLFGFRAWTARFIQEDLGDLACLILASTPIWLWQSQAIQIDMVFAAFLAWSWLCWLGGYLLLRDHARPLKVNEHRRWFLASYLSLSLAFLSKGPLALVLTVAVLGVFLAWQRDPRALFQAVPGRGALLFLLLVLPWYVAAGVQGRQHRLALGQVPDQDLLGEPGGVGGQADGVLGRQPLSIGGQG
jgi:4-amino-4-deoxy-L-arabinose transferase-like glycosyltransferase